MNSILSKSLIISLLILVYCCKPSKSTFQESSKEKDQEMIAFNDINFEFLNNYLHGVEIIGLGESTHGLGEFYSLKSELVKYLHAELGYEVIVFEAGFGDVNLASSSINEYVASELKTKTIFSNFRCDEIDPLFDYIKTQSTTDNPLYYAGIDIQISGSVFTEQLTIIDSILNLNLDIKNGFNDYGRMFRSAYNQDSTEFHNYKSNYLNTLSRLLEAVNHNQQFLQETQICTKEELLLIRRNLTTQIMAGDFNFSERFTSDNTYLGMVLRDSLMFENLKWIKQELYPNKKFVVWAHNAHLENTRTNNRTSKWLGEYLKDEFKEKYYSIGLFVHSGQAYQHWTGESIDFKNHEGNHIEQLLLSKDSLQHSFIDINSSSSVSWIRSSVQANEFENGTVDFIPAERFDAVWNIKQGSIPSYNK